MPVTVTTLKVSTHSHPKVAAIATGGQAEMVIGFNTQPPEGGCYVHKSTSNKIAVFQHTATRRWLHKGRVKTPIQGGRFNTQPPEGGCFTRFYLNLAAILFQHTATRRWLQKRCGCFIGFYGFQHTATRRWLPSCLRTAFPSCRFQHTATRRWLRIA